MRVATLFPHLAGLPIPQVHASDGHLTLTSLLATRPPPVPTVTADPDGSQGLCILGDGRGTSPPAPSHLPRGHPRWRGVRLIPRMHKPCQFYRSVLTHVQSGVSVRCTIEDARDDGEEYAYDSQKRVGEGGSPMVIPTRNAPRSGLPKKAAMQVGRGGWRPRTINAE